MTDGIAFHFSQEQQQFREFLRRFLTDTASPTAVRTVMESEVGYDPVQWQRLHSELSLPGLCIPDAYGGSGFGMVELGIAMEELGRTLLPSPFFASAVLAAKTIEHLGTQAQRTTHLPAIASGEVIATVAFMESPEYGATTHCVALNDRLTGTKRYVIDGMIADQLLITARESDSDAVYLVHANAEGVSRRPLNTIDQTRRLAEITLHNVPGERLGRGSATQGLARAFDIGYIALAHECAGGAARLFEDTLEYVKLRRQFGRTIASFQAIKHQMSELLLTVELAKSAAYYAAQAYDAQAEDLSMTASLAKASACDAYVQMATQSIQLHGGIGFTWENDTHLWFKRAKGSEVLLGDPTYHRKRMIAEMAEQEAA